ncbi:hypothetical protein V5P93_003950 [Actinokineospora auranticolor]|uniref:hypothetical protein n=1 Tax=Actinokineospora auranticolor TaxID=155976 RepID=UPI0011B00CF7|nr:hypothetical protein [Actinokineospora auranticolor]
MMVVAVFLAWGLVLLLDGEQRDTAPRTSCGAPALTYTNGTPLGEAVARDVTGVHAAACAGDYGALAPFVSDPTRPAAEIVLTWRAEDPTGVKLRAIAEVLERPGAGGQGGLVFCDPDKGLVVFSRGTFDVRSGLTDVEFPGDQRLVDCSRYGPDQA